MKRIVPFLLACLLLFAVATNAFAATYGDIATQPQAVQDAVYKLSALQIVNGYEDGTWRPDGNITRAEFAKIACLAGGYGNSYQSLNNTVSSFPDVSTGLWYTGWVNLAQGAGYMQGDQQGNFRPNDSISENEVLTVLIRLLGYNDNLTGEWPINYVRQAGALGLLDEVTFTGNTAAKRSTVALLTAAVLEEDMVLWQNDSSSFVLAKQENNTLLDQGFSAVVADVALEAPQSGQDPILKGWTYDNFGDEAAKLVFENTGAMPLAADFQMAGNRSIYDLAGHYGTAIYTVDDGQKELLYLELKSSVLTGEDLESAGSRLEIDGRTYSVAEDPRDTDGLIADAFAGGRWEDGHFWIYLNEEQEVYDVLDMEDWTNNVGVIDTVTPTTGRITYVEDAAWGDVLKVFKDKNVVVFKNNLVSKGLDALKPGDVITVVPCEGDSDVDYAILVLGIKNGVFTKLKDHTVTIGGQSYQADEEMRYTFNRKTYEIFDGSTEAAEELRGQLNATVTYYVGRNGKVACLQFGGNQAGSTIYGILTGFTVSDSKMGADAGSVTELEVYTSTGRTVTYEVEPEVYFSEESGMAEHDWQIIDHYATPQTSLMRFEVNSAGKVEKALEVELSGIGTQWEADKDYATFDGKELTDDFVAFHIKLGSSDHAIKSVSKISKTTLLRSSKASAQYGAYVEDKDGIPVLFFIEFGGVNYYQYGIISDVGFADSTVDYGVLLTTKSSTKKYDARNKGDLQALNLDSGDLVSYRIVSSEIDVEEKLIDVSQDFPAGLSSSVQQYSAVVESIASDRLRVKAGDSGLDYDYDSSTIILDYTNFDDPKVMKSADFLELDKEEYVVALFPDLVNRQYDELLAIVVLERQEGVDYDFNGFE